MNVFEFIFDRLDEYSYAKIRNVLIFAVSCVLFGAFLYVYFSRYSQQELLLKLQKSVEQSRHTQNLITKKKQLDAEKSFLAENQSQWAGKDLVKIVETSLQEQEITLDNNYKDSLKIVPIEHEPGFVEQQVTLSSNKLNLKKIITLINSLRNESCVMFRELKIENSGKTPSCVIVLSTRQKK